MTHKDPVRLNQIEQAAAHLFGTNGFYATSLQTIADQVGITKAGLLHYVESKNNLLTLVMKDLYDADNWTQENLSNEEQSNAVPDIRLKDGKRSVPLYFRNLARYNEQRIELVRLFTMLNTETLHPNHPAREYFEQRSYNLEKFSTDPLWHIPEGVDGPASIMTAFMAMDGVQIKWLRNPEKSLVALWKELEPSLFPISLWSDYNNSAYFRS